MDKLFETRTVSLSVNETAALRKLRSHEYPEGHYAQKGSDVGCTNFILFIH